MKHLRHAGLATCAAGARFRQATLKLHQKFLDRLLMRRVWVQRCHRLEPGNELPRINGASLPGKSSLIGSSGDSSAMASF